MLKFLRNVLSAIIRKNLHSTVSQHWKYSSSFFPNHGGKGGLRGLCGNFQFFPFLLLFCFVFLFSFFPLAPLSLFGLLVIFCINFPPKRTTVLHYSRGFHKSALYNI